MLLDILTEPQFSWEMVFGSILASLILIFLVSPVHELSHAAAALALGDRTPRWQGRITLNPLAHIDYIGSLMILLFGFGWAKPVEVNMRNFKNPKAGMAVTALAGPLSNFIIAFVAALFYAPVYDACISLLPTSEMLAEILYYFFNYFILINISIGIFNLIPIPPLDGSRILSSILPDKYYYQLMRYEQFLRGYLETRVINTWMLIYGLLGVAGTICAAILAAVGLTVLFQVCRPFDKFRKIIWCAMAGIMVVCFLFFGKLFELRTGTMESNLILTALVLIAPAVFRIMLLLNYGEKVYGYLKGRK